jgi:acetyl esterase/lipase
MEDVAVETQSGEETHGMSIWKDRACRAGEYLQYPRLLFGLVVTSFFGSAPERISIGDHPRQYMLAYEPREPARRIAVLFLHGGGWRRGRPEFFEGIGRFFARRGIAVAMPAYRLAPRHKHPAQLNDAAAAYVACIEWLDRIGLHDIPVVVGGNSAGAHIAAFLALDPRLCAIKGRDRIRGFLSMAGPLRWDLPYPLPTRPMMRGLIRKTRAWPEADPYLLIRKPQTFRLLALQGLWDPLIRPEAAIDFAKAWSPDGSFSELHLIPRHFHSDVCMDAFLKPCRDRTWILDFLAAVEADGLMPVDSGPVGRGCDDAELPEPMRRERPNPYLESDD